MSALHEFTGVGAIPAGAAGRLPKFDPNPKKKKKRAVDAFLESATQDDEAATEVSSIPPTAAPEEPAIPVAPAPAPAPVAPAPTPAPAPAATENLKALMISREVAEALCRGHSVSVRGILLEPSFQAKSKPATAATVSEGAVQATVSGAVASVFESTGMSSAGGAIDMNAPQPPPAAPTDGRAVMSAFRRFGGV